jgi:precorrin-4/cobalt-precorrin-4 C11-methyltransferase
VPTAVIAAAPETARVIDTSALTLDQIIAEMREAHGRGLDVARVHSGDLSLYGAIAEQMRRLDELHIPYDLTPGVPAFAAAAAALGLELTLPGIVQTVILTRTAVRASAMPAGEELTHLARSRATLAIHLSIANLAKVVRELTPVYGADCPVAVVHRASWPDQRILRGTLGDIRAQAKQAGMTRTAIILVGRALGASSFSESRLYAPEHSHVFRPRKR